MENKSSEKLPLPTYTLLCFHSPRQQSLMKFSLNFHLLLATAFGPGRRTMDAAETQSRLILIRLIGIAVCPFSLERLPRGLWLIRLGSFYGRTSSSDQPPNHALRHSLLSYSARIFASPHRTLLPPALALPCTFLCACGRWCLGNNDALNSHPCSFCHVT